MSVCQCIFIAEKWDLDTVFLTPSQFPNRELSFPSTFYLHSYTNSLLCFCYSLLQWQTALHVHHVVHQNLQTWVEQHLCNKKDWASSQKSKTGSETVLHWMINTVVKKPYKHIPRTYVHTVFQCDAEICVYMYLDVYYIHVLHVDKHRLDFSLSDLSKGCVKFLFPVIFFYGDILCKHSLFSKSFF